MTIRPARRMDGIERTLIRQIFERVEVIRGPGSALYGGFAEVSVIHVITRKDADIVLAHATGNVCGHDVTIFKFHAEQGIRKGLKNLAFHFRFIFTDLLQKYPQSSVCIFKFFSMQLGLELGPILFSNVQVSAY